MIYLDSIEEFWSKMKAGIRRNALTASDRLSDCIYVSVQLVIHTSWLQSMDNHAVSVFSKMKNGKPFL